MKRILFITRDPFAYNTDLRKWCEHLSDRYDITCLSFNKGAPYIKIKGVRTIYVPYRKNARLLNGIVFLLYSVVVSAFFGGFIFMMFFPKCHVVSRLLFWKRIHIDVRTLSIEADETTRRHQDAMLRKAVLSAYSASFITPQLIERLDLQKSSRYYVLPLGADIISGTKKEFDTLRLIYIGTFHNRNILDTVIGVHLFLREHHDVSLRYDIVGDGKETDEIRDYITREGLESQIILHGRRQYDELTNYLDCANIGVSYIPITDYYQYQPPTKTFEYALSGLYLIATDTFCNRQVINDRNGMLIQDNPQAVCSALEKIQTEKNSFNSDVIRDSMSDWTWKKIIDQYFVPIIENQ